MEKKVQAPVVNIGRTARIEAVVATLGANYRVLRGFRTGK